MTTTKKITFRKLYLKSTAQTSVDTVKQFVLKMPTRNVASGHNTLNRHLTLLKRRSDG